jgi:TatD DNase family protein
MLIDTHAHLDFKDFKHEVASVLSRARQRGVNKIINVGIDAKTSKDSVDLARRYPEIYAAVGVHPDSADTLDIETQNELMNLLNHEKIVAIGEIGLDYYYLKRSSKYARCPSRDEQMFCFEQMLDLALETKLPVIVHSRESDADTLAILKSYKGALRGVMHCFSGDYAYAEKIIDLGFAVSFTGNITFKNANPELLNAIKRIPIGSIMVETDSPFLSPEPDRGKRNEPANVIEVARKIAEIKDIPLAQVELETTKKANKLFKFS